MMNSNNQKLQNKTKLWKIITITSVVLFLFILSFTINYVFITGGVTRDFVNIMFGKKNIKIKENIVNEIITEKEILCDNCVKRKIDGFLVKVGQENLPQIAIMIDNHFNARPVHGIDRANLVYEAEVEGSFTRYMAIFDSSTDVKEIGPVRSARPYFIDWAQEFDAIYTHCGGSPEALVKIIQRDINDLNEFYNGSYFWRTKNKKAPHNILTSMENLGKYISKAEKIKTPDYLSWKYKEENPSTETSTPEIEVNFSNRSFQVSWKYNPIDNDYIRSLAGQMHLTAENNIISAKNIIIQKIPAKVIDEKLRLEMNVTGDGNAIICLDGKCRKATWEKRAAKSRTRFYYLNETEVEFNPGSTWIEIVRPEIEIIY